MPHFSELFGLNKTQLQLDFVDVELDTDIPLFIDPFALSQRLDRFYRVWVVSQEATLKPAKN